MYSGGCSQVLKREERGTTMVTTVDCHRENMESWAVTLRNL
jgi:hypothetical protein